MSGERRRAGGGSGGKSDGSSVAQNGAAAEGAAGAPGALQLPELAAAVAVARSLSQEADGFAKQVLDDWQRETAAWLGGIAGWKGARLMSFDAESRHVNAHFSESLVMLLREVRWLGGRSAGWFMRVLYETQTASAKITTPTD